MKLVAPASLEIYHVHDPVGLLKKVQGSLVLFTLDKAVCTVVQLGQHDRDLVLGDAKLLVVMLIEGVVFVHRGRLALISLMCATDCRRLTAANRALSALLGERTCRCRSAAIPVARSWHRSTVSVGRNTTR